MSNDNLEHELGQSEQSSDHMWASYVDDVIHRKNQYVEEWLIKELRGLWLDYDSLTMEEATERMKLNGLSIDNWSDGFTYYYTIMLDGEIYSGLKYEVNF